VDLFTLRLLERIHGHAAWLAVAALAHPAWLLRRPAPPAAGVAYAATGLVSAVFALGAVIYPSYRRVVKPDLFREHEALGWMFERKEHLAFGVLLLAWAGAVALGAGERRLAMLAYRFALGFAVVAAAIGVAVATTAPF
jgi:hypothetical protein